MKSNLKHLGQVIDLHSHLPLLTPSDVPDTVLMQTLYRALSVKRPSGSIEEAKFASWMATTFGATMIDEAGNIHFDRRYNGERSLITAHSDTVHHKTGENKIRNDGRYWRACGDVLGADDGAGCALIAHMLTQGVGGYFVIFRSEEVGGVGSKWLAQNMPELLQEFDRAVAFDMAGEYDVITHQGMSRCCSDEFASTLADQLSFEDSGLLFMPSDGGVYTDTAEFTEIIPECTNVSVFYSRKHSDEEQQDVLGLQALAEVICFVDWESLPTKRDPAEYDYKSYTIWKGTSVGASAFYSLPELDEPVTEELGFLEETLYDKIVAAIETDSYDDLYSTISAITVMSYAVPEKTDERDILLEGSVGALLAGASAEDVCAKIVKDLK